MNKFSLIFLSVFIISGYIYPTITPGQHQFLFNLRDTIEHVGSLLNNHNEKITPQINSEILKLEKIIHKTLIEVTRQFRPENNPFNAVGPRLPDDTSFDSNIFIRFASFMNDIIGELNDPNVRITAEMDKELDEAAKILTNIRKTIK